MLLSRNVVVIAQAPGISTFRIPPQQKKGLGGWLAWNFQSGLIFSIPQWDLGNVQCSGPQEGPAILRVTPNFASDNDFYVFFLWPAKRWEAPDSSFRAFSFAPASEIKKIRKSKNGASEMISVTQHNPGTNHRNGKWKTLSLKDMRWSEFPWRGNFRDKSQKCSGPGISDFPKLSVTALFWWAKGRRPLGPPKRSDKPCDFCSGMGASPLAATGPSHCDFAAMRAFCCWAPQPPRIV